MYERFTDHARDVVVQAQVEARELGHDHVGTEHLLLGLLHVEPNELPDVTADGVRAQCSSAR